MNNLDYGLKFLLISSVIFGSTMISASIYTHVYFNDGVPWTIRYGRFGSALLEIGVFPLVISSIFAIIGFLYMGLYYIGLYRSGK